MCLGIGVASGQSATSSETTEQTTRLAEVVVTAQKREEDLLKVPGSVTALSAEQLQQAGIVTFNDLADHVPGLSLQDSGGGGVRPVIRGVSSFVGSPTVAIYVDDAPIQSQFGYEGTASGGSPEVVLLDLDRVEVLSGPQGTLYGGSSMGGAIKYVMRKPSLESSDLTVRSEVSVLDSGAPGGEFAFAADLAPIPGSVGVIISGLYRHDGGFIDQYDDATNTTLQKNINDQNTTAGRVAVLIAPVADWTIQAGVQFQRRTYGGYNTFNSVLGYPNMDNVLPENGSDKFTLPSLTVTGHIERVELVSATSYFDRERRGREDYTILIPSSIPPLAPYVPILNQTGETTRTFTEELRLRYDAASGRAGVLVGGYYSNQRLTEDQTTTGLPDGSLLFYHQAPEVRNRESALFGEAYVRLWTPLKLTLGLRKSFLESTLNVPTGQGPFANPPTTGQRNDQPLTPKVNLSYDISNDGVLYAQAAEGFRTGLAAGPVLSLCDAELIARGLSTEPGFGSDSLWTYETGVKDLFRDGTIEMTAAIYHTNWHRKPESIFLSSCGTTITANVGDVDINGGEIESTFRVASHLTISANVGYIDSKYTNSSTTSGFTEGDPVPFVPKWSGSANARYQFTAFSLPCFALVDVVYRDKMLQGSLNPADRSTVAAYSDAYTLINTRLGTTLAGWDTSLFVNNLTNRHPAVSAYMWNAGTADRITTVAPLTVGVSVTRKF